MKKANEVKKIYKAAIALAVALALIIPSAAAFVNDIENTIPNNRTQTPLDFSGYMTVADVTADAGDTDVVIDITGEFDIEGLTLGAWQIVINYDPEVIIDWEVDFTGGYGQPAAFNPFGEDVLGNMTAGAVWIIPVGPGSTTQEELLCQLIVDISPTAPNGVHALTILAFYPPAMVTKYSATGQPGFLPDRNDGSIQIGDVYLLSVDPIGPGTVTLDPPGGVYDSGTEVTLTAVPDTGAEFIEWGGDLSGDTNPETIIMDGNKAVTATFEAIIYYDLTANIVGSGSVDLDPAGGTYEEGTTVELTATADEGWEFISWSGDLTGDTNPETIIMDSDKEVTATFEEIPLVPDLELVSADLDWIDVEPSSTVTGEIIIENDGDPGSLLDWEIDEEPTWGTFSFDPESGTDLTGQVTIDVEVVAPADEETEFTGTIKIVNSEDSSDYIEVAVSLVTPHVKNNVQSLFVQFLERLFERFPVLEILFSSLVA